MANNLMNNKLLELIKKNGIKNPNLTNETYASLVNYNIQKKYKFGEEHAIIRKTIYKLLQDLTKYGIDISKYNEFIEYYNFVEQEKTNKKNNL